MEKHNGFTDEGLDYIPSALLRTGIIYGHQISHGAREKEVMSHEELLALISEVQQHTSEMDNVKVKSAHKGTPQRLYEALVNERSVMVV